MLAFVVNQFPRQVDAYFLRELAGLAERGLDFTIYSLLPAPKGWKVHADAERLLPRLGGGAIGLVELPFGITLRALLERWLAREKPDVIQVNYSITERQAEFRLLKLAADRGLPVIVNRPFMNGAYFRDLEVMPLPPWADEFDCNSWSQFSLKFILSNPAVTCVLTETTDPKHMTENAQAALGRLPDEAMRNRMRLFIDELTV